MIVSIDLKIVSGFDGKAHSTVDKAINSVHHSCYNIIMKCFIRQELLISQIRLKRASVLKIERKCVINEP